MDGLNNPAWVWIGILFIVIGSVSFCFSKKCRNQYAKCIVIGYMVWLLIIAGLVMLVCGIGNQFLPANEIVSVNYDIATDSVPVTTVSTTLFTTLMTINLALIAIAITAYIFLIGALNGREQFEKTLIDKLIRKRTQRLIILSGYTGTCAVLCLIADNGNLAVCKIAWMRYCVAAAAFANIVIQLFFTYKVINYERELCWLAYKNVDKVCQKLREQDNLKDKEKTSSGEKTERGELCIKKIGDLESIVKQILKNHEVEFRQPQQEKEMLYSVFQRKLGGETSELKEMCQIYFSLFELRDSYLCACRLTERKWILNDKIACVESVVEQQLDYLKKHILRDERLMNQSFSHIYFGGDDSVLTGVSFRDSAFSNCKFNGAELEAADFTGVLFHDVHLEDVKSQNAVYSNSKFYNFFISQKSDFTRAVFADVDFNANKIGKVDLNDLKTSEEDYYKFSEVSCSRANFVDCAIGRADFKNAVFNQALLSHALISNCKFLYASFQKALLTGAKIYNCDMNYANLENVTGVYSKWQCCLVRKARMAKANFTETEMEHCHFEDIYADNSCFSGGSFKDVIFDNAILNEADFSYAAISECSFKDANLIRIFLIHGHEDKTGEEKADKTKTITKTKFTRANFTGAQIRNTIFQECEFDEAILNDAMLVNVVFEECSFRNTQLKDLYMMNVEWRKTQKCEGVERFLPCIEFATEKDLKNFTEMCGNRVKQEPQVEQELQVEQAVYGRRSTRTFVPGFRIGRDEQRRILSSGLQAPSPKNRQPWHFTIVDTSEKLNDIADVMEKKIEELKVERIEKGKEFTDLEMALQTANIIRDVSVLVFVEYIRDEGNEHDEKMDWQIAAKGFEAADLQAIGAAVENMLLIATSYGISSLWMCDVLYVHDTLVKHLKLEHPFVAAVAFGKEQDSGKKRADIDEKVEWID